MYLTTALLAVSIWIILITLIFIFARLAERFIENKISKQKDFKIGSYAYLDNNECVQILQKKSENYQVIIIDKKIDGNLLVVDKNRISHEKH